MPVHNATADVVFSNLSGFRLFLGSVTAAQDEAYLASIDCRHVMTVLHEAVDLPEGITCCHVPIKDNNQEHMAPFFPAATEQIGVWLAERNNVLVHCSSGISRSATIVLAFLVAQAGQSLLEAYTHVHSQRPCIQPGTRFLADLQELELATVGCSEPTMSLAQYYAFSVKSIALSSGRSPSYDSCFAAVTEFGWASDYALMQALERASA
eukprot:TRINITY_DN31945_c0_g1_i1.p2 TRINITY_DN31945_c0_g1~~TRINITY_DN31945_c0_g1_i1.p2  ORF type:complete len:235 (-),score=32.06 TRINITY_DN31945_c0_g1_i1:214-840(-)